MTAPVRVPGKAGRRRPDPAKLARALMFGQFWTGAVPAHPAAQDNLALLKGGWNMLGNQAAGNCVAVSWANFRRLMTAVLGGREVYPTQDQVWEVYKTQNPGFDPNGTADTNGPGSQHDQGMNIQELLDHLVKVAGPDGVKAVAFAKVNHGDPAEVEAALAIFGGLWTGVIVQQAQQDQFSQGKPWTWVPGSTEDGGHSVLSGGYTAAGYVDFITWATETNLSPAYLKQGVEELWLVIWPEHLGTAAFEQGVNQAALAAAYTALTGQPFPVTPAPAPAPTPAPGPVDPHLPDDLALVSSTSTFRRGRHTGDAARAVQAINTWMNKRGYVG